MEKSDSSRREHLQILAQLVLKQTPASAAEFNLKLFRVQISRARTMHEYSFVNVLRVTLLHVLPVKPIFPKHSKQNNYFLPTRSARQNRRFSPYVFVSSEAVSNRWLHKWFPFPVNEKITWPLAKCFMLSARGRGEVRGGQDQKMLGTEGSNHNHNYFSNEENIFIDPTVFTICWESVRFYSI